MCIRDRILRVRAEATVGRFRRLVFDHTSVSAEIEAGLRHPSALGLHEFGPLSGERQGVVHLASLGIKQQLLAGVRFCADARWELSADGGRHPGKAPDNGDHRPGGHLRSLRPRFADSVIGLDVSLGAGRAVAWVSPVRKQGLLELRL